MYKVLGKARRTLDNFLGNLPRSDMLFMHTPVCSREVRSARMTTDTQRVHQAVRRDTRVVELERDGIWGLWRGACRIRPALQARRRQRDPQYLHLLLGRLRHPDLLSGDGAKNAHSNIMHIEGDPDHPVNRGTLCPKGSALLDFVHSPGRLQVPKYRAPGTNEFKEVTLGFRARSHRPADEGRSRREFHREERERRDGQPVAHDRHAGGIGHIERNRAV